MGEEGGTAGLRWDGEVGVHLEALCERHWYAVGRKVPQLWTSNETRFHSKQMKQCARRKHFSLKGEEMSEAMMMNGVVDVELFFWFQAIEWCRSVCVNYWKSRRRSELGDEHITLSRNEWLTRLHRPARQKVMDHATTLVKEVLVHFAKIMYIICDA